MMKQLGGIVTSDQNLIQILNDNFQNEIIVIMGHKGSGRRTLAQQLKNNHNSLAGRTIKDFVDIAALDNASIYIAENEQISEENLQYLQEKSVRVIEMPNLSQRPQDIIELSRFFIGVFCVMNGVHGIRLTEKTVERLLSYKWPGQISELEIVIEKACQQALAQNSQKVTPQMLDIVTPHASEEVQIKIGMKLEDIERKFILQTLYFADNNRTKAAEILGISIRTLRNKINQYKQEGYL